MLSMPIILKGQENREQAKSIMKLKSSIRSNLLIKAL